MERTPLEILVRRIHGASCNEHIINVLNSYALEVAEDVRKGCININRNAANALYGIYSIEAMDLNHYLAK